ncbi:sugar isomerase domain-containing protein [Lentzea sp. NBRC 102530]|uniref:sugar isomerase domain-containing protein n=1 Tax=Lentzea sp. NBRC 102530 TaxID=3032201 RepID=UPI0024A13C3C|nr:sugar isomerase domain-containing protein [Lentzea sp. NBRC 102530]GLY47748.1 hypothetical protein Lesp01_14040 [Lentzea sp. NBRC 102530]
MTALLRTYADRLCALVDAIVRDEAESIAAAAALVAGQLRRDRLVHVHGPGGHSALAVQDVFYRAGCPVLIAPVTDPGTSLLGGALNSTATERLDGRGAMAVEGLVEGDLLIVVNAFGVNAASVGAARSARERGVRVIAVSSRTAAADLPADHPARAGELPSHADVHIDTHVPPGDVVLEVAPGVEMGGVSTALNSFVLHAVLAAAVEQAPGTTVWRSSYTEGGDAHNARAAEQVRGRVPQL